MVEIDSRELSWSYVTADTVLTDKSCDLLYANVEPSAAAGVGGLYNGTAATDPQVIGFDLAAKTNLEFAPGFPIYCPRGLFVNVGANVTGILVVWRNK